MQLWISYFSLSSLKITLFCYLLCSLWISFTLRCIAWELVCFLWGIMFPLKCSLYSCTVFLHVVDVLSLLMLQGIYTSFVYVVGLLPLWMSQGIYTVVRYLVSWLSLAFYRVSILYLYIWWTGCHYEYHITGCLHCICVALRSVATMDFTGHLNHTCVVGGSVATVSFTGCLHYICVDGGWVVAMNYTGV